MTRLFLRFYLGVIIILVIAFLLQSYAYTIPASRQNIRVIEAALSGGARLARERLVEINAEDYNSGADAIERLAEIQSRFEYPVRVIDRSTLKLNRLAELRLSHGDIVLSDFSIFAALPNDSQALQFGPLPSFVGPSQTVLYSAWAAVFFTAAVAIAILLRPVAAQLRAMERTATAIAEGDLSARIDHALVPKSLPLATAFNQMADQTEKLLRSQRELMQAVSHELRTPLARIRFAADLIETADSDEERRSRLDTVDGAIERLDDLVGELLTYVRLESDAPQFEPEPIDLRSLFEQLIELYAPLHQAVDFQIDERQQKVQVSADRQALARAIGNLLSNAGKYATAKVIVRARRSDAGVVIQVDDDGPGIPVADREKVFDPFVRLESNHDKGSGLGLALVHRITTSHGGSVEISESPMGGARFTIRIPDSPDDSKIS